MRCTVELALYTEKGNTEVKLEIWKFCCWNSVVWLKKGDCGWISISIEFYICSRWLYPSTVTINLKTCCMCNLQYSMLVLSLECKKVKPEGQCSEPFSPKTTRYNPKRWRRWGKIAVAHCLTLWRRGSGTYYKFSKRPEKMAILLKFSNQKHNVMYGWPLAPKIGGYMKSCPEIILEVEKKVQGT